MNNKWYKNEINIEYDFDMRVQNGVSKTQPNQLLYTHRHTLFMANIRIYLYTHIINSDN